MSVSMKDKTIIRDLAKRVAEIGHDPIQEKNREMWRNHNALRRVKPMVLVFPEGSWGELLTGTVLQCEDKSLHGWESHLRQLIYRWEHLRDDNVIEPRVRVGVVYRRTGWGIEIKRRNSDVAGGAWAFDPVISELADLKKLQKPTIELDEEATRQSLESANELFDGILPVVLFKNTGFENSLIRTIVYFIGLENLLWYLADRPEFIHEAMSFMTDATLEIMEFAEKRGYIEPNNRDDYVGSGGVGYSDELPTTGSTEKGYTYRDCWGFAETQEFALVSPEMHYEFALQYQIKMLDKYGLNCYGCCEALDNKFDIILKIPRLRRLSISPWADVRKSAEALQDKVIFSWKPNPADLAAERFNPDFIASKIRDCVNVAKDCVLEIVMKDTHTVRNEPWRMSEWVRIAKKIADEGYPT